MLKLSLYGSLFLTFFLLTASFKIECEFKFKNYYLQNNLYSCVIDSITKTGRENAQIIGSHVDTKTDFHHVQGLYGKSEYIEKLPKEFSIYYNLLVIYLYNGDIRELHFDDLRSFPYLKELYFDNNKIDVIGEGTFQFNHYLNSISFRNNNLYHINANVFDCLKSLTYLWLNGNICPNTYAKNSRKEVLDLIATAKFSCQSPAYLRLEKIIAEKTIEKSTKCMDSDQIFGNFSKKVQDLKEEHKFSGNQILEKINDFIVDYGNMRSEFMDTLNSRFIKFKNNLKNCN